MNVRERFEKVQEQQNRFSLRTRLTAFVTLELVICILVAFGIDAYPIFHTDSFTEHNFIVFLVIYLHFV